MLYRMYDAIVCIRYYNARIVVRASVQYTTSLPTVARNATAAAAANSTRDVNIVIVLYV